MAVTSKAVDVLLNDKGLTGSRGVFKKVWYAYNRSIEKNDSFKTLILAETLLEDHGARLRRRGTKLDVLETACSAALACGDLQKALGHREQLNDALPANVAATSSRLERLDLKIEQAEGNLDELEEEYTARLEEQTQSVEFRYHLVGLELRRGNEKKATTILVAHLREYPTDMHAVKLLRQIYIDHNHLEEAISVTEDNLLLETNLGNLLTLAELLATQGEVEQAVEYFSFLLMQDATNYRVLWQLLVLLTANPSLKDHFPELRTQVAQKLRNLNEKDAHVANLRFGRIITNILDAMDNEV